jgi:hypothetical protein
VILADLTPADREAILKRLDHIAELARLAQEPPEPPEPSQHPLHAAKVR